MTWNVGEFVESQLLEHLGFESTGVRGRVRRRVDEQHVIVVSIRGFDPGKAVDDGISLQLALGRHDINVLSAELVGPKDPWQGSVRELLSDPFLGRPHGVWYADGSTPERVGSYLERWIPPMQGIANLPFIEEQLHFEDVDWDDAMRERLAERRWTGRVLNQMLWGWRPHEDEAYFEQQLGWVSHFPADSVRRLQVEAQIETLREWIAAHPDGIDRKLIG